MTISSPTLRNLPRWQRWGTVSHTSIVPNSVVTLSSRVWRPHLLSRYGLVEDAIPLLEMGVQTFVSVHSAALAWAAFDPLFFGPLCFLYNIM